MKTSPMSDAFSVRTIRISLVTRRSTLCSGRPSSALRGMTVPEVILDGPSKASATAAGIVIVGDGPPVPEAFRRCVPVLLYVVVAMLAANRLPDPYKYETLVELPFGN